MKKKNRAHGKNKNASEVVEKIENMGIDSSKIIERTNKLKNNEKMSHLVKRTRKFK
jgi:phosphoribosylanthranilate isomerase